ncbi:MAG: hypothetical protein AUJ98_05070 [Bacteroidetes bacterium CG2_30_33_31]|nr:MAG: hypothetical protein AUJ98_05070 [Bacteroidetes bacterium CG2_30_33_31]
MRKRNIILIICSLFFIFQTTRLFSQTDTVKLSDNLLKAAAINSLDSAVDFLKQGAKINFKDEKGNTPLIYAIQNNNFDMVKMLEFNSADLNLKNNEGLTPLITAIRTSNFDIAEFLCYKGADPNITGLYGTTPLHYAINQAEYYIIDMLIFYGADLNKLDFERNSVLHYAAYLSDTSFVNLLLKKGAIEMKNNFYNLSPLKIAIQYNNKETAKILFAADTVSTDVDKRSNYLITYSINYNNDSFALFLIHSHKFIPSKKNDGNNPYNVALLYREISLATELKREGFNSGFYPYFSQYTFMTKASMSKDDAFYNFGLNALDSKYGLKLNVGLGTRFKRMSVFVQAGKDVYYQYWERRTFLNFGIKKHFYIKPNSELISLFAGFDINAYFGNYRGSSRHLDKKFGFSPSAGISLNFNILQLELSYNYMNYAALNFSPNFFAIGIGFKFNNLNSILN